MLHATRILKVFLVAALLCAIPAPSFAGVFVGVGLSVNLGPPALPVYVQPPCPVAGYIWTPGYWGWGPGGYYWVPGTWVAPPAVGLLWTPGYWGAGGGYYAWHPGYWGPRIGFYGGVNYGFGYFGVGYVGGGWFGNVFRYNTAVTNVNTTVVRNVYVNKTVVVNNYNNTTVNRVSYNGGPGGLQARPTAEERVAAQERRAGLSAMQRQHINLASRDHNLLASVNNGRPTQLAVDHPYSAANRPPDFTPLRAEDRQNASDRIVSRGAPSNGFARDPSLVTRGNSQSGAWERFNGRRGSGTSGAGPPSGAQRYANGYSGRSQSSAWDRFNSPRGTGTRAPVRRAAHSRTLTVTCDSRVQQATSGGRVRRATHSACIRRLEDIRQTSRRPKPEPYYGTASRNRREGPAQRETGLFFLRNASTTLRAATA